MKKRIQSLSSRDLADLVSRQLNAIIPDPHPVSPGYVAKHLDIALERTFFCFSAIRLPYYNINGGCIFSHLNSDHYCLFLYFLSNTVHKYDGAHDAAAKIFLLNKYLHGVDLFYSIDMPEIFLVAHPLGTIIGKASYKNYTVFYQNVTIGSSTPRGGGEVMIYPKFEERTIFYAKSAVIGDATCGENVVFAANSFIINTDIPSNTTVTGIYPRHKLHATNTDIYKKIFEL